MAKSKYKRFEYRTFYEKDLDILITSLQSIKRKAEKAGHPKIKVRAQGLIGACLSFEYKVDTKIFKYEDVDDNPQ